MSEVVTGLCRHCYKSSKVTLAQLASTRTNMNVLLVGLPRMQLYCLQRYLKSRGICVDIANTGQEAMEKLNSTAAKSSYCLVVLNVDLADKGAATRVLNALKQSRNGFSGEFVVGVTQPGQSRMHQHYVSEGMACVYPMPLTKKLLGELLAELLSRHLNRRQLEVLKTYNQGYDNEDAAKLLNFSIHEYEAHLSIICEFFNIKNDTALLYLAAAITGEA